MKKLYLFILFYSIIATNFAQDVKEYKLNEIIVTADRVETPAIEVANSVTIISAEEIMRSGKSSLPEILRETAGVYLTEQGGPGRISSLFLRGAASNFTLVLIDGMEVNDPSSPNGAYDFSNLPLSNIERIEIVREPQSTLYGSDALAGVINIITKNGGEPKLNLNLEGGSEKFAKGSFGYSGKLGGLNYYLGYSRMQNEGISAISEKYGAEELDGFSNNNVQLNLNYTLSKNHSLKFNYNYTYHKAELDNSGPNGDDPNYNYNAETQLFNLKSSNNYFNGKLQSEVSAGFIKRIAHTLNLPDDVNSSSSANYANASKYKLELLNHLYLNDNNLLSFGFEMEEEKANTDYYSTSSWGSFNSSFLPRSAQTKALFLQDKFKLKNFFVTAGIRYDIHQKFGDVFTYRVAPAYFISSTGTKLKATFSTGYKTPSLFNLFDPSFGNPDLKPEKSKGWDAGIEQFISNDFELSAVYFNYSFVDLIGFDAAFKPVNINKASSKGVEIEANYKMNNFAKFNLSYTYTKAVDESDGANKEDQLIRRPEHKAVFGVEFSPIEKLDVNASVRYVGKRYDNDFSVWPAKRTELKEYTIADMIIGYEIMKNARLYLKVDNLLNTDYEEVLYYGTLGRSFYLGVNISY